MQNAMMKAIFIAAPFNPTDQQRKDLERTCFEVSRLGGLPLSPALYLPLFLDLEHDSAAIMQLTIGLLEVCQELWYVGTDQNHQLELSAAKKLGIPVRHIGTGSVPDDLFEYALN